jgi:hypothetical protein
LPAPAIANGDGNGFLGIVLAHDVFIQFGDDFARGHLDSPSRLRAASGYSITSTSMF